MKKLMAVLLISTMVWAVPVNPWKVSTSKDKMTDEVNTEFSIVSQDKQAVLVLTCSGDGEHFADRTLYLIATDYMYPNSLTYRIDSAQAQAVEATSSTTHKQLSVPDIMEENQVGGFYFVGFAQQLLSAKVLRIRVGIYQKDDKLFEFHPAGLEKTKFSQICNIPQ